MAPNLIITLYETLKYIQLRL